MSFLFSSVKHFIDQYWDSLEERVKHVFPILYHLLEEGAITMQVYADGKSMHTSQEQMRELFKHLNTYRSKEVFYRALKEDDPFIFHHL